MMYFRHSNVVILTQIVVSTKVSNIPHRLLQLTYTAILFYPSEFNLTYHYFIYEQKKGCPIFFHERLARGVRERTGRYDIIYKLLNMAVKFSESRFNTYFKFKCYEAVVQKIKFQNSNLVYIVQCSRSNQTCILNVIDNIRCVYHSKRRITLA